ncbi:Polygalacturonase [Sesamum angolense]|uniref:Polygalacturonase n=1 Tax=Sesamum angolense TaxID=2727404 RepID=A0AAE1W775_9LAMI|nr:Polygalacturonase [Sesamum angolense]
MPRLATCFWAILLVLIAAVFSPAAAYNVVNFGARGDGQTDSTAAFLRAWKAACSSATPAAVSVPRERTWLTVVGGTFDAKGSKFWSCRRGTNNCPVGARSISFQTCSNVVVSGLTSLNSQTIHIGINESSNIKIQNVKIIAPSGSPNTDGIHIASSRGVTITSSTIRTGDDCVSVGPGSMNVYMEKIGCGPGHGISVGSLGNSFNEEGVQNVTVINSVFTKTENGVRVKSWARPSGGYAQNLNFKNLIMRNVANPIIIDQQYCPDYSCPHQSSGVRVSQVTYKKHKGHVIDTGGDDVPVQSEQSMQWDQTAGYQADLCGYFEKANSFIL